MAVESGGRVEAGGDKVDDDGRASRSGTIWTASSHIITAVIGAGVLSLAWAMSQLGWLIGIIAICCFSAVTLFTADLLADCYRSPDPVTGKRNYSYMEAVKNILGGKQYLLCWLVQYGNLTAVSIGYTITASMSLVAIRKVHCFHNNRPGDSCRYSNNPFMIGIGIIEIFLSQLPSFHDLSWLSLIASITSFGYAFIGIGLSLAAVIRGKGGHTSLLVPNLNNEASAERLWEMLVALGNIALATIFAQLSIDIQDTLRSSPPENETMKKANKIGVFTMTIIFLLCACSGYAAFGPNTPGSILMASGFKEPFWLIDIANLFIFIHIIGAYQIMVQPVFRVVETKGREKWANSAFVTREYVVGIGKMKFQMNMLRLVWRSTFVVVVTVLAMAMPFFNNMLALLGAIGFWPSVVYFPVEMTIARLNIKKRSLKWLGLESLNFICFLLTLASASAAVRQITQALGQYKPFMYKA